MHFSKILPAAAVLLGLGTQLSSSALAQLSEVKLSDVQLSSLSYGGELIEASEVKNEIKIAAETEASETTSFSLVEPTMLMGESELIAPIHPASDVQPNVLIGEGSLDDSDDQLKLDNGIRLDHFKFDGEAGDQITITGESSDFDIFIGLFLLEDDQLKEISINDNASETTTNAKIEATLSDSGTYAIIVAPASVDGRGDYTITLDGIDEG